jgi:bifunctional non-homologous end joining protein LigD
MTAYAANAKIWLLIKQRDVYEGKDDDDTVLDQGTSVASGRTMDQIAAGKGRGPEPFMIGGRKVRDPRGLRHSNRHIEKARR